MCLCHKSKRKSMHTHFRLIYHSNAMFHGQWQPSSSVYRNLRFIQLQHVGTFIIFSYFAFTPNFIQMLFVWQKFRRIKIPPTIKHGIKSNQNHDLHRIYSSPYQMKIYHISVYTSLQIYVHTVSICMMQKMKNDTHTQAHTSSSIDVVLISA